jgi:predicted DNA-binding protein with PD1-like motif
MNLNFKQISDSPRTFIIVFETGDELAEGLLGFAIEQRLSAANFKAVGALSSVRLGWFSWEGKRYEPSVTLDEQVELIAHRRRCTEGRRAVHAHAVIGKKDDTTHGGHLLNARIRPTCELVLTEPWSNRRASSRVQGQFTSTVNSTSGPDHLQKFIDPQSGLALIKL